MREIIKNIWHVGDNDCSVYLADTRSEQGLVLIDAGMDLGMIRQIESYGFEFSAIKHCILTHCHIDHIGICADLKEALPHIKFYAHKLDAVPIEEPGHDQRTAASWYGVRYRPVKLSRVFTGKKVTLSLGKYDFKCLHTPGHTPGSISILVKAQGKKVLFGQDLHGPFNPGFLSDLNDYQKSMQWLLDLEADILCEGHFGIFKGADSVQRYIHQHKEQNCP